MFKKHPSGSCKHISNMATKHTDVNIHNKNNNHNDYDEHNDDDDIHQAYITGFHNRAAIKIRVRVIVKCKAHGDTYIKCSIASFI